MNATRLKKLTYKGTKAIYLHYRDVDFVCGMPLENRWHYWQQPKKIYDVLIDAFEQERKIRLYHGFKNGRVKAETQYNVGIILQSCCLSDENEVLTHLILEEDGTQERTFLCYQDIVRIIDADTNEVLFSVPNFHYLDVHKSKQTNGLYTLYYMYKKERCIIWTNLSLQEAKNQYDFYRGKTNYDCVRHARGTK